MPPRCRFTREEIVSAAIKLTREKGFENVSARSVGAELGSSQNVIFSSFENMEELKEAVVHAANNVYQSHLKAAAADGKYPLFKSGGMAYVRFAVEEKELFRLLFMRDRTDEGFIQTADEKASIGEYLQGRFGLDEEAAMKLYFHMWLFVHGIASLLVTGYMGFDEDKISELLNAQFKGMAAVYGAERV